MLVNLEKGQKVDLTKGNPTLKQIRVGLGWDTNDYDGSDFDLDASIFLLGGNGKVSSSDNFVYYGNLESNGVKHTGDNLTGEGDGDDEIIKINLSEVPSDIEELVFTVTIYDAEKRRQNFGQVSNAYIRILNDVTNEELIRFDLGEDYSVETALVVGRIYRHGGDWKFDAVGSGFSGGLASLCSKYGLNA